MQKKKIDAIAATGAQTVVTSCPGCMIQLMDGIRRHGLKVAVKHISQYL
jgi:glycolate oxidase iron-sulfur subunit